MMVGSYKTVADIVNDQEMTWTSIFDLLCYLHRQFHVGVGAGGYAPRLGSIIESLSEESL